jgi:hypothetical protein
MARRLDMAFVPDAVYSISSCGPFNVSISKLQLGPFLWYSKSGQTPQGLQFGIIAFLSFCGFSQFDFVEQ